MDGTELASAPSESRIPLEGWDRPIKYSVKRWRLYVAWTAPLPQRVHATWYWPFIRVLSSFLHPCIHAHINSSWHPSIFPSHSSLNFERLKVMQFGWRADPIYKILRRSHLSLSTGLSKWNGARLWYFPPIFAKMAGRQMVAGFTPSGAGIFKQRENNFARPCIWGFVKLLRDFPTHLREYGEGLTRRPLAHPELGEDVLELLVVDDVVAWGKKIGPRQKGWSTRFAISCVNLNLRNHAT